MIKLLGIALIAVGFAFRMNALLVVLAGGIATGMLAGFPPNELMALIGRLFVEQRNLTLAVILMLPVVGVLERHGLQAAVAGFIRRVRAASPGRVAWVYQVIRGLTSMVGLSIGNHASLVRPLIAPMAEAAAPGTETAAPPAAREAIRAHAAAAENVGNFFSDDLVVAVGALLLVKGFFETAGVEVAMRDLKVWGLPTALWVLLVGWWRYRRLDAQLGKTGAGEARRDRKP